MTLEEKLERLTERHEALTQTVELVAGLQRQNEQRLGQIMEAINSLVHVAEIHEQRLDDLENRP